MSKYVDVEQVCLWLQPVGDQVIAKTGQASVSQKRIQKQLAKWSKIITTQISLNRNMMEII